MARFFAKEAGARVMVQGFGEATVSTPVDVPESVAAELSKHPGLVGEMPPAVAVHSVTVEEIAPKRTKPAKGEKE